MALRRCWRSAGVIPRLLWKGSVPHATFNPAGRSYVSCFVNAHQGCRTTQSQLRRFSSEPASTDVSYEQLKQVLADREAVVIDVREPWELREYGFIPGAINVPRECCSVYL
ncbi:unnamed protein product, partial [Menidia menidia]